MADDSPNDDRPNDEAVRFDRTSPQALLLRELREKSRERRRELHDCSERVSAVVWGSLVHDALKDAIERKLLNGPRGKWLLSEKGPLASFGAMHDVAYAAGMISEDVWNDLFHVRKIRNLFAHKVTVKASDRSYKAASYDSDALRFHTKQLRCPRLVLRFDHSKHREWMSNGGRPGGELSRPEPTKPRVRFEWTCHCLVLLLETFSPNQPVHFDSLYGIPAYWREYKIYGDWSVSGKPLGYKPIGQSDSSYEAK